MYCIYAASSLWRKMCQHAISLFFIVGFVITPQSWSCKYNEFMVKGESTCRPCPMCLIGEGINKKCMSTNIYDPDKIPQCKPCIMGKTFSNYVSRDICYPCSEIIPNHRVVVKCTRSHDRRIECKHGYFDGLVLHQCNKQCCYCDEQSTRIKKCQNDKMKNGKFCAPKRNDGICDPPITTTPSPRSTATPKSESTPSPSPRPVTTSLTTTTSTNPTTPHGETSITPTSSPIWSTTTPTTHHTTFETSSRPRSNTTSPTETPKSGSPLSVTKIILIAVLGVAIPAAIIWVICAKLNPSNCTRQENTRLLKCGFGCTSYDSTNDLGEEQEVQQPLWQKICGAPPTNPIYEDIKNVSATSSNATSIECIPMSPGLPPPRRTPASTADSSRRNSGECLILIQPEEPSSSRSPGCTTSHFVDGLASRGQGILLSTLGYLHMKALADILDIRGVNVEFNWLEFGLYIAAFNELLKKHVNRCHECYYGGGSATLAMFSSLSKTKPFLKLKQFRETATLLGRSDIVEYLNKRNICSEDFFDIEDEQQTDIAFLLETRKEKGNYWPQFAAAFDFSDGDIQRFQEKKRTPQNCSPTLNLIRILNEHRPEITIHELQIAAIAISRHDAYHCLVKIAQEISDESST